MREDRRALARALRALDEAIKSPKNSQQNLQFGFAPAYFGDWETEI